jgi:ribosome-binding factor A
MIREELIDVISGELRDPRVGLAQVTEVKLAPDMHVAHVFVSVMGGAEEEQRTLQGLIAARAYLRGELARRLQVRHMPELRFEVDRSEELELRLDKLLSRAKKRSYKNSNDTGDASESKQ